MAAPAPPAAQLQALLNQLNALPIPGPHPTVAQVNQRANLLQQIVILQAQIMAAPPVAAGVGAIAAAKTASPPVYDGKSEVREWLQHMERYFTVCAIPAVNQVDFASLHLAPKVSTQWNIRAKAIRAIPAGQPQHGDDPNTWQVFVREMTAMYGPMDPSEKARRELGKLKQGKMPVEEFQKKFSEMASLITDRPFSDNDLVGKYWDAIDPELKVLVKTAGRGKMPTTLNDLYTLSIALEPDLMDLRKANKSSEEITRKTKSLSLSENSTVSAKNKRKAPAKEAKNGGKKKKSRLQSAMVGLPPLDPEKQKKLKEAGKCFICEEAGHMAYACPKKPSSSKGAGKSN